MGDPSSRSWPVVVAALAVLLGAVIALYVVLSETERAPDGPAEVIWDGDICAHCRMHIGEPAFAAQIQTVGGEVYNFDDPGCLFEYSAANHPEIRATWYHHHQDDRWIAGDQTGFVRVDHSPMGYGIGAVDLGDAELTAEAAAAEALAENPGLTTTEH